MRLFPVVPAFAVLGLVACDPMGGPLSDGGFDPLTAPGSGLAAGGAAQASGFKPGQFVRAMVGNTAFFNKRPRGNADADKLLPLDTQMKVVSMDGAYLQVELDSGEVGYVPAVMVSDPNETPAPVEPLAPGTYQVYPPVEGTLGTPDSSLPTEAIPPIIDPEVPSESLPLPPSDIPDPVTD